MGRVPRHLHDGALVALRAGAARHADQRTAGTDGGAVPAAGDVWPGVTAGVADDEV